jgi:hypothetical protein
VSSRRDELIEMAALLRMASHMEQLAGNFNPLDSGSFNGNYLWTTAARMCRNTADEIAVRVGTPSPQPTEAPPAPPQPTEPATFD